MKLQSHWYALHTASRAEKKIKQQLDARGVVNYLPMRTELHQWSDRKKRVTLPLITGYIFVCVPVGDLRHLLPLPGICNVLSEDGHPAAIPDKQIRQLELAERYCSEELRLIEAPLPVGSAVRVTAGPLCGVEGELVSYEGNDCIALRIDNLGCALLRMDQNCIESIKK